MRGNPAVFVKKFTFQYVSINTKERGTAVTVFQYLHSNMFLLIRRFKQKR